MHQLKYNNYIPVLLVFFLTGVSCIRKNSEKSTSKNIIDVLNIELPITDRVFDFKDFDFKDPFDFTVCVREGFKIERATLAEQEFLLLLEQSAGKEVNCQHHHFLRLNNLSGEESKNILSLSIQTNEQNAVRGIIRTAGGIIEVPLRQNFDRLTAIGRALKSNIKIPLSNDEIPIPAKIKKGAFGGSLYDTLTLNNNIITFTWHIQHEQSLDINRMIAGAISPSRVIAKYKTIHPGFGMDDWTWNSYPIKERSAFLGAVRDHFLDTIKNFPDGAVLYNEPLDDQREKTEPRAELFEKFGFGPKIGARRYAIMRDGKLVPSTKNEVFFTLAWNLNKK
jgi:hypothetical protein